MINTKFEKRKETDKMIKTRGHVRPGHGQEGTPLMTQVLGGKGETRPCRDHPAYLHHSTACFSKCAQWPMGGLSNKPSGMQPEFFIKWNRIYQIILHKVRVNVFWNFCFSMYAFVVCTRLNIKHISCSGWNLKCFEKQWQHICWITDNIFNTFK